jgi:hypothetical protein
MSRRPISKEQIEIVERHAKAMLAELRAKGHPALGIAGGIVFHDAAHQHGFYVLEKDCVHPDGSPVDPIVFKADIGHALMKELLERSEKRRWSP